MTNNDHLSISESIAQLSDTSSLDEYSAVLKAIRGEREEIQSKLTLINEQRTLMAQQPDADPDCCKRLEDERQLYLEKLDRLETDCDVFEVKLRIKSRLIELEEELEDRNAIVDSTMCVLSKYLEDLIMLTHKYFLFLKPYADLDVGNVTYEAAKQRFNTIAQAMRSNMMVQLEKAIHGEVDYIEQSWEDAAGPLGADNLYVSELTYGLDLESIERLYANQLVCSKEQNAQLLTKLSAMQGTKPNEQPSTTLSELRSTLLASLQSTVLTSSQSALLASVQGAVQASSQGAVPASSQSSELTEATRPIGESGNSTAQCQIDLKDEALGKISINDLMLKAVAPHRFNKASVGYKDLKPSNVLDIKPLLKSAPKNSLELELADESETGFCCGCKQVVELNVKSIKEKQQLSKTAMNNDTKVLVPVFQMECPKCQHTQSMSFIDLLVPTELMQAYNSLEDAQESKNSFKQVMEKLYKLDFSLPLEELLHSELSHNESHEEESASHSELMQDHNLSPTWANKLQLLVAELATKSQLNELIQKLSATGKKLDRSYFASDDFLRELMGLDYKMLRGVLQSVCENIRQEILEDSTAFHLVALPNMLREELSGTDSSFWSMSTVFTAPRQMIYFDAKADGSGKSGLSMLERTDDDSNCKYVITDASTQLELDDEASSLQQKNYSTVCCWEDFRMKCRSIIQQKGLLDFYLNHYEPTAKKDTEALCELVENSSDPEINNMDSLLLSIYFLIDCIMGNDVVVIDKHKQHHTSKFLNELLKMRKEHTSHLVAALDLHIEAYIAASTCDMDINSIDDGNSDEVVEQIKLLFSLWENKKASMVDFLYSPHVPLTSNSSTELALKMPLQNCAMLNNGNTMDELKCLAQQLTIIENCALCNLPLDVFLYWLSWKVNQATSFMPAERNEQLQQHLESLYGNNAQELTSSDETSEQMPLQDFFSPSFLKGLTPYTCKQEMLSGRNKKAFKRR